MRQDKDWLTILVLRYRANNQFCFSASRRGGYQSPADSQKVDTFVHHRLLAHPSENPFHHRTKLFV
jgi:hypothetical protein